MYYRLEGILCQCYTNSEGNLAASSNLSLSKAVKFLLGYIKLPKKDSMTENQLNAIFFFFFFGFFFLAFLR